MAVVVRRTLCASIALLGMLASAPGTARADDARAAEPLRVFAAASLTAAFQEIAADFRAQTPGTDVQLNLGASSSLVSQIREGAPADVIATADEVTMATLGDAHLLAGAPAVFARGRLVVVVEPGNPKGVRGLADLARTDLLVVLAAPEVPAGRYARDLLSRAGVAVTPRSLEANVKGVVTKVALGEADAGIAYRTDVIAARGTVAGIDVPEADAVPARYPVAVLAGSGLPGPAKAFVALLLSARGREILSRHGFDAASPDGGP